MTNEESIKIRGDLSLLNEKADKMQEFLCSLYLSDEGHFSHPATCSFSCPFCDTISLSFEDDDEDTPNPSKCKAEIYKMLCVEYLKNIIK